MGQLSGRTAVVTGGSTGIGLATVKRLAEEGALVHAVGRRPGALTAAVADVGHGAIAVRADVSRPADLDRLFDTVSANGHRVDILFANAGGGEVFVDGGPNQFQP
ncbi:SDR family NAD(P)-dependent oxidoreductase [Streptomyces sp. NPDC050560]|uniref:SDR family NAD(P)-dependent oxidoreductase n=1 Tax=Streptomyces sp. NPDC050560 TaxID=3365630 RepID=UPI0037B88D4A